MSQLGKGPWPKTTLLVGSLPIEQGELADSTGGMRSDMSRSFWGDVCQVAALWAQPHHAHTPDDVLGWRMGSWLRPGLKGSSLDCRVQLRWAEPWVSSRSWPEAAALTFAGN